MDKKFFLLSTLYLLVAGSAAMVLREELLAVAECYKEGCPRLLDPVCGSDGKTYLSPCRLREAACVVSITDPKEPELTTIHKGDCSPEATHAPEVEQEPAKPDDVDTCYQTFCPFVHSPVCGSDGKTYPNECVFGQAVCALSAVDASAPKLTVVSQGACAPTDDKPGAAPEKEEEQQEEQEEEVVDITTCHSIACPRMYSPVCGSDGKTYSNLCVLVQAACVISVEDPAGPELTVEGKGECGSTDEEPEPVPQLIESKPEKKQEQQQQQQEEDVDITTCHTIACSRMYSPVCGSDGKTYSNICVLAKAACVISAENPSAPELTVEGKGECGSTQEELIPQLIFSKPAKKEEQEQQQLKQIGGIGATQCVGMFCPAMYEPVCGSDGKTYSNVCTFAKAACIVSYDHSKPPLTIASKGECGSTDEEPEKKQEQQQQQQEELDITTCHSIACPRIYKPVCGSDGKTYSNLCVFAKTACVISVENPSAPELSVEGKGECGSTDEEQEPEPQLIVSKPTAATEEEEEGEQEETVDVTSCFKPGCPRIYYPVCGSDGKTYSNTCMFQQAVCASKTTDTTLPELTIVSKGTCEEQEEQQKKNKLQKAIDDVAHILRQLQHEAPQQQQQQQQEEDDPVLACLENTCGRKYLPVCASDGKTYSNTCLMDQASCVLSALQPNSATITAEYIGECGNPWPVTT